MKKRLIILFWIFLLPAVLGRSEILSLPGGLTMIDDEAFLNCSSLHQISIPDTVEEIADNAFLGCGEALLLHCSPGSPALVYAREHSLDYQAGTVYRALVIGQTYDGTDLQLYGPRNDAAAMEQCLSKLSSAPFSVTALYNLSASEMKKAILSVFSEASEQDVSLFYYSGHGDDDGSLVGMDFARLSPEELKSVLDQVPGRKVILADACASGVLIARSAKSVKAAGSSSGAAGSGFSGSFLAPFARQSRGAFNASDYFVITGAFGGENTQEMRVSVNGKTVRMGVFTYAVCRGCGWMGTLEADRNADGAVSIEEAYTYARDLASSMNGKQSADVWPSGCLWFAPFRNQTPFQED